jgi:SAM-dependent methyltransferase
MESSQLRGIFDGDAELYDRARPGYPAELFADLVRLTGIGVGARVLEVGPGTGQATTGLVATGATVTGVELGPALAAQARRRLGEGARIVTSAFEEWPLPAEPFDLVLSATAWHWVDRTIRIPKAARALRPGGFLAIVGTSHVAGGTAQFFIDVQTCYEQWDPATPPGLRLTAAADLPPVSDDLEASGLFGPTAHSAYEVDITYSTAAYLEVLQTYSGTRALPAQRRRGLLAEIGSLIETSYGGTVTKRYLNRMRLAQRL